MIQPCLAAALLIVAQASATSAEPCLNRAEAADLTLLMLPGFIEGAATKCTASLPGGAFLRTRAGQLAARLRSESAPRSAQAFAAFAKVGTEPMPDGVSDATLKQLVNEIASGLAAEAVKPSDCAAADDMIEALSPLPAANLGRVVAGLMAMGGDQGDSNFRICAGKP